MMTMPSTTANKRPDDRNKAVRMINLKFKISDLKFKIELSIVNSQLSIHDTPSQEGKGCTRYLKFEI